MKVAKKLGSTNNKTNERMTMKGSYLLTALACLGFTAGLHAATGSVTINFQEHGNNMDLGAGAVTFTESPISLTAQAFGPNGNLFSKFTSGDPTETGLGFANESQHEIAPGDFIQLTLPPTGPAGSVLTLILTGSLQGTETVSLRSSDTSGVLGTEFASHSGDGNFLFTIPSSALSHGFLDVTANSGDVVLAAATVTFPLVPDGGTTIALLGGAITALGLIRRKLIS